MSNIDNYISNLSSITIKINATHLNYVNGNAVLYTTNAAKNGASSWLTQYAKPQLLYHDKHRDPVGRVIDFKIMDQSSDINEPQDYVELDVKISDPDAIAKVIKGLYYTCSVGSSTTRVRCSACNQILTEDGLCEHEKGSIENGQLVYWIIDEISYDENSFVNNPADPYSRIKNIDIGNGYIPYKDFLDHRESLINELIVEDEMKYSNKLSAGARAKLPDSAFCGPERSFPGIDENHIREGLKLIDASGFSDDTKAKIKAALYRKGKQFGVVPSNDELTAKPNLLTFRIDDNFTEDEVTDVAEYFLENPEADVPNTSDAPDTQTDGNDTQVTLEDVQAKLVKLEKTLSDKDDELQKKIKKVSDLTDALSDKDAILNSKEDEINKLLDDTFRLDNKYKQSIIDNIIDLSGKSEKSETLYEKYNARQIDSLVDTINDLRDNIDITNERVEDPTTTSSDDNEDNTSSEDTTQNYSDDISRYFLKNNGGK